MDRSNIIAFNSRKKGEVMSYGRLKAMPSKSIKQARTMRAAAHDTKFAKKMGIPKTVAQDYVAADQLKAKGGKKGKK